MLEKNSIRIKPNLIVKIVVIITLSVVVTANAKIIVENVVRSSGVDEELLSEAVPRLNRDQLKEAEKTIDNFGKHDLTSIFTSDTLDIEATSPGIQRVITLKIQNASGISGAAADIAEIAQQKGYQINEISTAPALQKITTVIFKTGLAEEAKKVEAFLKEEGWPLGISQQSREEVNYDISIILGR